MILCTGFLGDIYKIRGYISPRIFKIVHFIVNFHCTLLVTEESDRAALAARRLSLRRNKTFLLFMYFYITLFIVAGQIPLQPNVDSLVVTAAVVVSSTFTPRRRAVLCVFRQ